MKPSDVIKTIAKDICSNQNRDYHALSNTEKNTLYNSAILIYLDKKFETTDEQNVLDKYREPEMYNAY